jgi:hypothetical protein
VNSANGDFCRNANSKGQNFIGFARSQRKYAFARDRSPASSWLSFGLFMVPIKGFIGTTMYMRICVLANRLTASGRYWGACLRNRRLRMLNDSAYNQRDLERVDILINNAGTGTYKPFPEVTEE